MGSEPLSTLLEREHRDIDAGVEAFMSTTDGEACHADALRQALGLLRRHIYLEEVFLFPSLREAGLMAPIFVMLREHGEMWETLDALAAELGKAAVSSVARDVCAELAAQLTSHNGKEEPVLYPQADSVLSPSAAAQLRAFLTSAQLPEGWVCERARP
jgi:hemerythrin-like domain-containing protein